MGVLKYVREEYGAPYAMITNGMLVTLELCADN